MNPRSVSNLLIRIMLVGSCIFLVAPFLSYSSPFSSSSMTAQSGPSNNLSNHWLASKNCYRDEINPADVDYNNCWMDNAGKILAMSELTGDSIDANRSLGFIEDQLTPGDYYLPELEVINGNLSPPVEEGSSVSISNGLVELTADNSTASHFDELAIGTSYTGDSNLAYVGGDRIWLNSSNYYGALSSNSSSVFLIPNGFSKRSFFQAEGNGYYVYVNATLVPSEPYANVSVQLEPIGSSPASYVEYLFLQVFNSTITNPFYGESLYSSNGSYIENISNLNASGIAPASGGRILLDYSNAINVFSKVLPSKNGALSGQDAVAIKFGNASIYDWEDWINDPPFAHSWFGPGYHAPQVSSNALSAPIYSEIYPILDFDYHLANETVKYVASSSAARTGLAVSPPVSFGFVSYGLALYSSMNPSNSTLRSLARGYWNYYYDAYEGSTDYGTPYARSINLLALAGFELYGCNETVENFARNFIGNTSGGSIEEYGWGTAALYDLKSCTGTQGDSNLYDSFVNSFGISNSHYIQLSDIVRDKTEPKPNSTFGFAEAASGLMLGGVPYNDSIVIRAMDAVYQSNVNGTILNTPYSGDIANTETLPAYMLSTWLFQSEMRNNTGYWITSISNANITALDFAGGTLSLVVYGDNGSVSLMKDSSQTRTIAGIDGNQTFEIKLTSSSSSSSATTVPFTSSATFSTTSLSTTSVNCSRCAGSSATYILAATVVVLVILSAYFGYHAFSRKKRKA